MQVFGVLGPGSDRLVERFADRVDGLAVVHATGESGGRESPGDVPVRGRPESGGSTRYALSEEGWSATGDGLTPDDVLDRLAIDHDVTVVRGAPDANIPQVVLGDDQKLAGTVLLDASDPEAVDIEELLGVVEALEPHETLHSLVARVKRSPVGDRAGAIATFTGRVRAKDGPDDPPTEYLEFEKHEGVADERMRAIAEELEDRDGVYEVAMHHRTGVVPAGVDIVFVVVLAGHRKEAFRTVEDGIDRLKAEVPLFKKEVTTDEEYWVHEGPGA